MQASMQPQLASAEVASRLEVAGTCQELPSGEQLALDMNTCLKRPEQCCKALLHQGQVCNTRNISVSVSGHVRPCTGHMK